MRGGGLATLDFFIVNVAIPSVQDDLHAGPAAIQSIVAGFGLAYAAALLAPQVLAILNAVYTGRHRTAAFNAFGLAMGFGGVFGQLIGGVLIQANVAGLGWRTIFLINVPVGVLALVLVRRMAPDSRATGRSRLDLTGTLLVSLGLVAVVLPLVVGREAGWPLWTWLAVGYALLAVATTGGTGWLIPGLVVAGAGMGLVMGPLPAITLAGVDPQRTAAASGVLNAAQQAGGAIGVALVGVVFYQVLGTHPTQSAFARAFSLSEVVLAGIGIVAAGLVQLLPRTGAGRIGRHGRPHRAPGVVPRRDVRRQPR